MSIRIKCVIIVVLILGLLKILGLIKKNKLELKYALSWLFLEVGILIITLIPNLLNVISKALGIYNEINMLFFLGFVFIIAYNVAFKKLGKSKKDGTGDCIE